MSFKKITSILLFLSFFILLLSSVVLYIAPPSMYSSWGGWDFLSIEKGVWRDLHIVVGFLFFIILVIHMIYNFKLLMKYFVKKSSFLITKESVAAVIIFLFFCIGTAYEFKPLKDIADYGHTIKQSYKLRYSRPPFRNAESRTFEELCLRSGIDPDKAKLNLEEQGLKNIEKREPFKRIAKLNNLSPKKLYKILKSNI